MNSTAPRPNSSLSVSESLPHPQVERPEAIGFPSLGEWWRWLLATKWLIAATVTLIAVITVGVIVFSPRTYRSTARLMLKVGRENVTLDPTASAAGATMQLHMTQEHELATAMGVMRSRSVLEPVVQAIGAETILSGVREGKDEAVENRFVSKLKAFFTAPIAWLESLDPVEPTEKALYELSRDFSVSAAPDSSVVEIAYQTKSADVAHDVVANWVQSFMAVHKGTYSSPESRVFFEAELKQTKEKLDVANERLRLLKDESSLVTVDGQRAMLESELTSVRGQMNEVDANLAAARSHISQLDTQLLDVEPMSIIEESDGPRTSRDDNTAKLYELEVSERDLSSRYKDIHPELVAKRKQLDDARTLLDNQKDQGQDVKRGMNPIHQRLETELRLERAMEESFAKRHDVISERLVSLQSEMQNLNKKTLVIESLSREVAVLESQFFSQSNYVKQAEIDERLRREDISSVREVQPASLEYRPVSPKKLICLVFGASAMAASMIGIPLVFGPSAVYRRMLEYRPRSVQPRIVPTPAKRSSTKLDYVKPVREPGQDTPRVDPQPSRETTAESRSSRRLYASHRSEPLVVAGPIVPVPLAGKALGIVYEPGETVGREVPLAVRQNGNGESTHASGTNGETYSADRDLQTTDESRESEGNGLAPNIVSGAQTVRT